MKKHKKYHKVLHINPWIFLIVAILSGVFSVYQLRANNEHMLVLRQAVYDADKANGDVQGALKDLQAYVTRHMNTDLQTSTSVYPPIQLKYTYERLAQAQGAQAQQANSKIYTDAQAYCESKNSHDFSGRNRVPCIQEYISTHTTQGSAVIPDALYKFSFASPRWSPDLAGWSIMLAIFSGIMFVITFLYRRFFRY